MEGFIVLVGLAVPGLLIVALAMIAGLKSRVAWLEAQVAQLQAGTAGSAAAERTLDELMGARQADARTAADAAATTAARWPAGPVDHAAALFSTPPSERPLATPAAAIAVVLAKLVMIDRQHLGSGFGISSFIAYGLLCTAVG